MTMYLGHEWRMDCIHRPTYCGLCGTLRKMDGSNDSAECPARLETVEERQEEARRAGGGR